MAATRFADLARLRLGSFPGYVFCHQGCCEHSLFFRDVRVMHPADSRNPAHYPQLVYQVGLAVLGLFLAVCMHAARALHAA
jgi:snRNA-activating protein complex subunit 3